MRVNVDTVLMLVVHMMKMLDASVADGDGDGICQRCCWWFCWWWRWWRWWWWWSDTPVADLLQIHRHLGRVHCPVESHHSSNLLMCGFTNNFFLGFFSTLTRTSLDIYVFALTHNRNQVFTTILSLLSQIVHVILSQEITINRVHHFNVQVLDICKVLNSQLVNTSHPAAQQ